MEHPAGARTPTLSKVFAATLVGHAGRYLRCFRRREQREHALNYLRGLVSELPRKSIEPIAASFRVQPRNLQRFVGEGAFDDRRLTEELRAHVAEEIGCTQGVLVVQRALFRKAGTESVGVARDRDDAACHPNQQVGVILGYGGTRGEALVDRRLYLPRSWGRDPERRAKCHVPPEVRWRPLWQLAVDLVDAAGALPHCRVVLCPGLALAPELWTALRQRGERCLGEVPGDLRVSRIGVGGSEGKGGRSSRHGSALLAVGEWAAARRGKAWARVCLGDRGGRKTYGMATCEAVRVEGGLPVEPPHLLLALRPQEPPRQLRYYLADPQVAGGLEELASAAASGLRIEAVLAAAKTRAGLAHYEVRSWVGWHHHTALSFTASWFLSLAGVLLA